MRKIIIILIAVLLFQACMPVARLIIGFKNPEVVSIATIEDYLKETQLYEGETYYLSVSKEKIYKDSTLFEEYVDNLFFSFNTDVLIFDRLGNRLEYTGTATCGGTRLNQCYDSLTYYYTKADSVKDGYLKLEDFCNRLQSEKGEKVHPDGFPKADYYIIQAWNTFLQNKKRTKEDFEWYKGMQQQSPYNFHMIYVNTDLQENWGLKKGAKVKISKKIDLGRVLDDGWES